MRKLAPTAARDLLRALSRPAAYFLTSSTGVARAYENVSHYDPLYGWPVAWAEKMKRMSETHVKYSLHPHVVFYELCPDQQRIQ